MCLLLSACVLYPNIGKCIREPGEICTGLTLPFAAGYDAINDATQQQSSEPAPKAP